jgi:hypothetical protein
MQQDEIQAIAQSLQAQWTAVRRTKRAVNTSNESTQIEFVRHLASQLNDAVRIGVSSNSFEQQLVRESNRVRVYEDRELLVRRMMFVRQVIAL